MSVISGSKDIFYVAIQFFFFCAFLFNINALNIDFPDSARLSGAIIFALGMLVMFFSILQLNRNLSAFPTPKRNSNLIKTGLYKYIRHPVYTGIITAGSGFSVYSGSGWRLIITLLLLFLFYFKSKYEEQKLKEIFNDYPAYMKKTGRFLPKF